MSYRCVKAKDSNVVIAVGADEGQGGAPYYDEGTWCDFTFSQIPVVPSELIERFTQEGSVGKVVLVVKGDALSYELI